MALLVKRDGSAVWYVKYKDPATGEWKRKSTGTSSADEAQEILAEVERQLALETKSDAPAVKKPLTVAAYAEKWLSAREGQVRTAGDDRARLRHLVASIGEKRLDAVEDTDVQKVIDDLRGTLAPRSRLHVYRAMRAMFKAAVKAKLVASNPCQLERHELPKKRDADPEWRALATFTISEVERLISDPEIPVERRVQYALKSLAGLRHGEVAALRWRHYGRTVEPLGKLTVAHAYDSRRGEEKSTKTETTRKVPVHPQLAKMLASWRLEHWERTYGRPPKDEDLVVPARTMRHVNASDAAHDFKEDLGTLGMRVEAGKKRNRGGHDLRAWFITTCQEHGAHRDLLRVVTHAAESDVVSGYTRATWGALCAEVAKLRIELRDGKVITLPLAQAAGSVSPEPAAVVQSWSSPAPSSKTRAISVRAEGLEPSTNGLRVRCSTN